MIKLENVSFSYGREPFIKDLNVTFDKGAVTTIIGPNGCGKSTILKLASRLLAPSQGRVMLGSKDIKDMKAKDFAKEAAVLLQGNNPPHITVENIVMSGRYPYQSFIRQYSDQDKRVVDNAIEMAGCCAFRNKEADLLSGGERQRVYLAMVLAQDTDVIFLDEPTTYLDINISYEIMDLIASLNRTLNKTIIMVLHDLNLSLNYSHKIVLMGKGKVTAYDTPQNIVKNNYINQTFNVDVKCFKDKDKAYYCFDKNN